MQSHPADGPLTAISNITLPAAVYWNGQFPLKKKQLQKKESDFYEQILLSDSGELGFWSNQCITRQQLELPNRFNAAVS